MVLEKQEMKQRIQTELKQYIFQNKKLFDKEIYGDDFHKMLLGIQNLIEYLNRVYFKDESIEEEVESMTKTLYDQEVEKKGIEKGKVESAKGLLKLLDDETIAKSIGLDIEIVKKIREKAN